MMATKRSEMKILFIDEIISLLKDIDNYFSKVSYKFMDEDEFKKLADIKKVQLIYWSEIIQRLHIVCATTLLRMKKWYDAILRAYQYNNYYAFCASTRGLIEACSDSFDSLGESLCLIFSNFSQIKTALLGEASAMLICEDLEDYLIHYIYGRKINNAEKKLFPNSHSAKTVRGYLDSIQMASLDDLYSELCQISHPSALSLAPFITELPGYDLALHGLDLDDILIDDLLKRHEKTVHDVSLFSIITALSGLKIINRLDAPFIKSLKTNEEAFNYLEKNDLWTKLTEDFELI